MKIALITDQHFGCRNDSIQFHEYFEKFYMDFFFPTLEENGVKTIIELGDIFDRRKYVNFDSLYRCKKYFFNPIRDKKIDLHCIVGNHDVYFKNTNRVNSPRLVLDNYKFSIYDVATEIKFDDFPILFVPWITVDNQEKTMDLINSSSARVVMGHLELQGFEMYRGAVIDHGQDHKVFRRFDMVLSGHFHHKSKKDNIYYLGAPYEMTWSDYDDPRGFHIFDTETMELTYFKNPYSMFYKVFYDDVEYNDKAILSPDFSYLKDTHVKVVVKNKNNPYLFDLFVDRINATLPAHVQVVEDNFHLDMEDANDIIDEAEDTVTIIKKYIKNLNLSEPKLVEDLFHELYHEALTE